MRADDALFVPVLSVATARDVEKYPEFVPLCQALRVRKRMAGEEGTETLVADMTVAYKLIRETFVSRVTLDRPNLEVPPVETTWDAD